MITARFSTREQHSPSQPRATGPAGRTIRTTCSGDSVALAEVEGNDRCTFLRSRARCRELQIHAVTGVGGPSYGR